MKLMLTMAIGLMTILPLAAKDENDHTLVKLWKEWQVANNADKPQDELKILTEIKKQAKAQKLAWDYFDACETYVRTARSVDWKLRDSLETAKEKEFQEFSEPIVWFYGHIGQNEDILMPYVKKHEAALKASRNPEFYTRDWRINAHFYSNALPELLKSDYDYALWCIEDAQKLQELYKDYPLNAFAEYRVINDINDKEKQLTAYKNFAEKYKGKAVALAAEGEILEYRWNKLLNNDKSTSNQYKELAEDCRAFEKKRAAFSDSEAKIVEKLQIAKVLLEQMERKRVSAQVKDGKLTVTLQNLENVTIKLNSGDKTVFEKYLVNPKKSFFVEDELLVELPDLADGTYSVKCTAEKVKVETEYQKYTISAAARNLDGKIAVWATDYISGKPFQKIIVEAEQDGKVLKSAVLDQSKGFTTLPDELSRLLLREKNRPLLRVRNAADKERASRTLYVSDFYKPDSADRPEKMNGFIITDRSAFNPDETVKFKAILYRGYHDFKVAAGIKASVTLLDTEGKELEIAQYTSNEYGSIDGSFILKRCNRNGRYTLRLSVDGKNICSQNVLVDDFVLPTFDLIFDGKSRFERPVETVNVCGTLRAYSGHSLKNARIVYSINGNRDAADIEDAPLSLDAEGRFCIPIKPDQSGADYYEYYRITVKVTDVTGETMEFHKSINIVNKPKPSIKTEYYFDELVNEDGRLELKVVAGEQDTWMAVEIYGIGNKLISSKVQKMSPAGKKASTVIKYDLSSSKDEAAQVKVIYFQNKNCYSHTSTIRKINHRCDLDLEFSRFLDTTAPKAQYSFEIKTAPGVECAATIFDKSTERFASNIWYKHNVVPVPGPSVEFESITGINESYTPYYRTIAYGKGAAKAKSAGEPVVMMQSNAAMFDSAVAESVEEESAVKSSSEQEGNDIELREDFATTIAWEPYLRSDENGKIKFTFTNADKLSTYYVQLYAHDKDMHNAATRREMVVTIPVKISLAEPRFLYEGDRYAARIGLSSSLKKDIKGTITLEFLNGSEHKTAPVISKVSKKITVPAGGAVNFDAETSAPEIATLGIKATFRPDEGALGSDGIFLAVPVKKAVQTLSESHSGVVLAGTDKTALEKELRSQFVNVPGADAVLKEISILDMVKEALPEQIESRSDNAISLSRALYAHHLCTELGQKVEFDRDEAIRKLMACKGEDGGFAWFEGMSSSPIVTAVVLQHLQGLGIIDETAAVHYLDKEFFKHDEKRWWYRGISLEQYLAVRSLFPGVSLDEKVSKDIKKEVKAYLVPKKVRGLNGMIFSKARRLQTLENLLASEEGIKLAKKMGVKFGSKRKMQKSLEADVASLVQYARPHKNGGTYYPNAVMPWRGLLETELDAHSCLCAIMDRNGHSEISDGIRIWIMLQKETQNWKSDPGYLQAIGAVLEGSDEILSTSVLALSAEYTKAFKDIKAAGNGMSIAPSNALPEKVKVGDRIKLSYNISNEENRSFVKLTIPFNAGLVPVDQRSGYRYGCYRNVTVDCIECWYEVYPEEKTVVSEEFYVTRAGAFQCPATTIKCEYAPHYEANTEAPAVLKIVPVEQ